MIYVNIFCMYNLKETDIKKFYSNLFREYFDRYERPMYDPKQTDAARHKFSKHYMTRQQFSSDYSGLVNIVNRQTKYKCPQRDLHPCHEIESLISLLLDYRDKKWR